MFRQKAGGTLALVSV